MLKGISHPYRKLFTVLPSSVLFSEENLRRHTDYSTTVWRVNSTIMKQLEVTQHFVTHKTQETSQFLLKTHFPLNPSFALVELQTLPGSKRMRQYFLSDRCCREVDRNKLGLDQTKAQSMSNFAQ